MKKILTVILICFTLSAKADYWTQKANFPGAGRMSAVGFSINNKGYVGTGFIQIAAPAIFANDFYEFDPFNNTWIQKADYPAFAIEGAGGCGLNNNGYIVCGWQTNQFFQYDQATGTWITKLNFPTGYRVDPISFSIGDKVYCGTGSGLNGLSNDLWEFNTLSNSWTQKASLGTAGRRNAIALTINNYGYVGTGFDVLNVHFKDFWQYDPALNTWTQKADVGGPERASASAFAMGNKGYVGGGTTFSTPFYLYDFWEYDPAADQWTQKASYPGAGTIDGIAFSINNRGYMGTGMMGQILFNDFWEYTPGNTTGINEYAVSSSEFTVFPNPAKEFIVISYQLPVKEKIKITITDAQGKKVYATELQTKTLNFKLETLNYPNGIYFVILGNGKEKLVRKFLKEF